jgi:hypothetical protein
MVSEKIGDQDSSIISGAIIDTSQIGIFKKGDRISSIVDSHVIPELRTETDYKILESVPSQ